MDAMRFGNVKIVQLELIETTNLKQKEAANQEKGNENENGEGA